MIGIITYNKPHRKTQEIIFNLLLNGFKNIDLIVIPWIERKNFQPIFKHRPSTCPQVNIVDLCKRLNLTHTNVDIEDLNRHCAAKKYKHILIAGAGILPDDLSKNHNVINAHPGYLPYSKGLDAFKWALLKGHPIGVTTHYISYKADEGLLIEKRKVPIYFEDSFGSVCQRIYETEIAMLTNAIKILESSDAPLTSLADETYTATRRMPHYQEIIMMERFKAIRKKAESINNKLHS